jgi:hypothetical protein
MQNESMLFRYAPCITLQSNPFSIDLLWGPVLLQYATIRLIVQSHILKEKSWNKQQAPYTERRNDYLCRISRRTAPASSTLEDDWMSAAATSNFFVTFTNSLHSGGSPTLGTEFGTGNEPMPCFMRGNVMREKQKSVK